MLAEAQSELILGYWWQLAAATTFMAVFVTAFSLMTDALRDALIRSCAGWRAERWTCRSRTSPCPPACCTRTICAHRGPAGALPPRPGSGQGRQPRWGRAVGGEAPGSGVHLDIPAETTVALVGESGSGKSVTAMSILTCCPTTPSAAGRMLWDGRNLLGATPAELRALRGRQIACVFQDPMGSLTRSSPSASRSSSRCGCTWSLSRRAALARAEELLAEVGLPEPRRRLSAYPHELSGGQQQRVMIAIALACEPRLLIADEPTTALDVTIQRQILELLERVQRERRMSLLFISHDLGVVGEIADRVVVMRHGQVREQGPVEAIFTAPQDAYTRALLACRPALDSDAPRLAVIDDHLAGRAPAPARRPRLESADDAPVLIEARGLGQDLLLPRRPAATPRVQGGAGGELPPAARAHAGRASASRARARRRWA